MNQDALQPLVDRLADLQARRDAALQDSHALSEEITRLIEHRAQLEADIARLKQAMADEPAGT
jgi:hypothetical protein